ncbi:FAD/NAD-P-binding domain-containing protein [Lentinus tigrinus ALCF2SS1-6]|uniref:FAD/NAD-P-binding domain-containing protein n=1 Tax=Lentinus tigrinus ALCF2SS1-6 TaxID=1328759 RepID=A0A5C2SMU6_9APHY|nr:FAD/NAD-P-binding domain-containing protein [Lentinus tigrinus ALCF2SS1-6]
MSTPNTKGFQVAVIGGGVCGLACAIALQNAGIAVEIFEAAVSFGEVGAGIGLGPNAIRALEAMGLLNAVLGKLPPGSLSSKGFLFYSGVGNHELVYDYPPAPEDASISMHRAVFLDALVGLVDPRHTHFNKRCTSISELPASPGRLVVHFQDGSTHETDVVLGADGIKSVVRDFVVRASGAAVGGANEKHVAFSNTAAYRGLIPAALLKAAGFKTQLTDRPACFIGPDKHVIVVPIKNGELINVAAFSARYDVPIGSQDPPAGTPWVDEISREDLQKEFEGWGSDIATLLRFMPEKTIRWSVHVVYPPLESYARGRVALLGDAAHAMLPHLGAGAGQGIEDAFLLTRLLSHPQASVGNVQAILQVYSDIRRPRSQMVWDASQRAGAVYDGHGPRGPTAQGSAEDLRDLWKPVWRHDLDAEFEDAIGKLRSNTTF